MTEIPDNRKIRKEQLKGVVKSIQAGTNVTVDDTDPENPIVSASGGGAAIPNDGFSYIGLNGVFAKSQEQSFEPYGTGTATLVDSATNITYTYGSTLVQVDSHSLLGIKRATVFLDGIASSGVAAGGELRLFSSSPEFFDVNTDPANCIFKVLEFSGTDYTDLDVALFNPIFQNIGGVQCLRFRRKVDPAIYMPPFTSTDAQIVIYIWSYD